MTLPHFFIDEPVTAPLGEVVELRLDKAVLDHMRTLRLKTGEHIVLVDAPGHGVELQLAEPPSQQMRSVCGLLVRQLFDRVGEQLTLVQGISASDRMDQTIRQTTELGVVRIIPLESERSTVRLDAAGRASKTERWRRIARSAAEQSARLTEPEITEPVTLPVALKMLANYDGIIVAWEEQGGEPVGEAVQALADKVFGNPRIALFIGPEGGFSHAEADALRTAGARVVTLGDTILRTETAAVVASTLVLYHLGGLGAPDA
jgi:16S rRNA (uracil1498-N3)-methyltransferase